MYIGKHLIDAYAKKVAEDVADATYPKIKQTVTDLIKKVFVRDPIQIVVYVTAEDKIKNPKALRFAIHAPSKGRRGQQKIKFIFDQDFTEEECEVVAEQVFQTLESLHSTEGLDDPISQEIAAVDQTDAREAYFLYDKERQKWNPINPHQQIQQVGKSESKSS